MRRIFVMVAIAVTGVLGLTVGAATAWASTAQLHVSPVTVAAGHPVHVSGVCDPNTSGFVISSAFLHDAAHDFGGVGAVAFTTNAGGAFSGTAVVPSSRAAGTYAVTARCGGGNLGIERRLRVVASHGGITAVPAGTGGIAGTTSTGVRVWQYGIGLAGILLLAVGATGLVRQRRAHRD